MNHNPVGEVYGKLTITSVKGRTKYGDVLILCRCECGWDNQERCYRSLIMSSRSGKVSSCRHCRPHPIHYPCCIGRRFGRLVVLEELGRDTHGNMYVKCQCDCGRVASRRLLNTLVRHERKGKISFCRRCARPAEVTREYKRWTEVMARCYDTNCTSYARYGARGIYVAEAWHTFEQFHADMGFPPTSRHSLDRIDNDGPYAKWNCRWATGVQQANNNSANVTYVVDGKRRPLANWLTHTDSNTVRYNPG